MPIIKFLHTKTNLWFDITVNRLDGLNQLKEVEQALQFYPEMKYLLFLNKCMLKQRDLSETYNGGVGSYLLFCMVLCFLRETRKAKRNYSLGEFVLYYLEFYGVDNWSEKKVLMRKNQIVFRGVDNNYFSLMSPQN